MSMSLLAIVEMAGKPHRAVKDPLYRLTRTDRTNPGATPSNQWTWNYDAVGNRTSAQKDSEATTSSYNEKNQLTGTTGGGRMLWRGTLDEPGNVNLTSAAASINGQPARMLAGNVFEAELNLPAGANNVTIQAQDGSGNIATKVYSVNVIGVPSSYTYDANGNLSAKTEGSDSWTYTWNALNQLTAVTKNALTVATYSYDPAGRRVEKIAGATTTTWTYRGEDVLRQDATTAAVTVATRFIHGPDIDEPMAQEDVSTGSRTFLHVDALGSVVGHTNLAGSATQAITYDVWGNIQAGDPGPFGFTGREWDSAAQMYFYRARWYAPGTGRFTAEDPKGFAAGENFYLYVGNRPADHLDPFGRESWKRRAERRSKEIIPGEGQGNPQDAIRHCLASCYYTVAYGPEVSFVLGLANEKKSDWDPIRPQPVNQRQMDDVNNYCGREAGRRSSTPQECEARCVLLLVNGTMIPSTQTEGQPGYGPVRYREPEAYR